MNLPFINRLTQNISVTKWSNGKNYLQRILNMLYYFKYKEMHLDHSGIPHDTCCRVWCELFSSFINRDTHQVSDTVLYPWYYPLAIIYWSVFSVMIWVWQFSYHMACINTIDHIQGKYKRIHQHYCVWAWIA